MNKKIMKLIICNNIILKKKKKKIIMVEKNKVKKNNGIFNICGEIIGILSSGLYDILISADYKEFDLQKNDICRISNELFKVVSFSNWVKILNESLS